MNWYTQLLFGGREASPGETRASPHPTPSAVWGPTRSVAQCMFTAVINRTLKHRKHKSGVSVALAKRSPSLQELLAVQHSSIIPRWQIPDDKLPPTVAQGSQWTAPRNKGMQSKPSKLQQFWHQPQGELAKVYKVLPAASAIVFRTDRIEKNQKGQMKMPNLTV